MKVLIVGGTGFIGPFVARALQENGHEVAVFHRGKSNMDLPVEHILGDWSELGILRPRAGVVIDFILSSGRQARELMDAFRGIARRVVAISSCDVYRSCGVLHGSEDGPLEPVPLTEESALRTKPAYPPEQMRKLRALVPWLDDEYDKIPAERIVMGDPKIAGTVLRLPMVYGPGDFAHRLWPVLKRIDDGRRAIIFEESLAQWRAPRGYVENVAAAIARAAIDDRAAGRVYNIAERPAFSELEWARKIAAATKWPGEFVVLPRERAPRHLVFPGNAAQHWEVDSSRIRRELDYSEPVPIEEGIRRTIEWERANPPGAAASLHPPFDYAAEDAALSARGAA
ncbi:MAG TPA: NAD-dependent epimerase/dehydratase family protein [Bryobacteraceae bacterium]|nr:NAD-dependent epimerase/dehydratase family protein [Bryobacteraceae bacterium]